jgi:hypothetical protein
MVATIAVIIKISGCQAAPASWICLVARHRNLVEYIPNFHRTEMIPRIYTAEILSDPVVNLPLTKFTFNSHLLDVYQIY